MPGARHPRRGEVRTLDHTHGMTVGVKQKVTVSIEEHLLARIDELVQSELMESRSGAIEAGIEQLLAAQVEAEYCCVARPMSRLVAAEMARSACAEVVPFCVLCVRGPERSGTHARYRAIGDSS